MKNRYLIIALIVAFILSLASGCASEPQTVTSYDDNGNRISTSSGHTFTSASSLPAELKYNNTYISLIDVAVYENIVDYSHNLFVVFTLDVSKLSDSELHWLRESDLDSYAFITSEQNEYDADFASYLGSFLYTETKELKLIYTSDFSKDNRYSFSGSDVSITIETTQEETYEYKNDDGEVFDLHCTAKLLYIHNVAEILDDPETIESPLKEYIAERLHEKASSLLPY